MMEMSKSSMHFPIFFLFFLFFLTKCNATESDCIYGIYVQTGSIKQAGTHSTIGMTLSSPSGDKLEIPNLEDWGLMGPGFNYFETGEMNMFGAKGPCLDGPICGLNLTSNGSGPYHAWYCDYVEVSTFGLDKECSKNRIEVQEWLAMDRPPYKLSVSIDICARKGLNSV